MAHKSEKFDFMLKYGGADYLHKAVTNNYPELGKAKIDVISAYLDAQSNDTLRNLSQNHPHKVMRSMAGSILSTRKE